MIHVFFPPGMFATTIEYVIKAYSREYAIAPVPIGHDGSMETYTKQFHPVSASQLTQWLDDDPDLHAVTTPIYPFPEHDFPDIIKLYGTYADAPHRMIVMCADTMRDCELNMLFQHHKIVAGKYHYYGLDFFFEASEDIKAWNQDYQSWRDMQPWQLREWYSLFYPGVVQKWISSRDQAPAHALVMTNRELLQDPVASFRKILQHAQLEEAPGLELYSQTWLAAQQYVLKEFDLLDEIIDCALSDVYLEWAPLSFFAESILQNRFRMLGNDLRCHGLDHFPTNTKTLTSLLER
jgi:hypothetical protein